MSLLALSPIDGRYATKVTPLRPLCSEFGLMRFRVLVEIRWLQALAACPGIPEVPALSQTALIYLEKLATEFSEADAANIKTIETTTNHDVKAVEYFLKEKFQKLPELAIISEFIHFACTSEDINNVAYALMLKTVRSDILIPQLTALTDSIATHAKTYADIAMLARTHGQPATPTTVGKEFANFANRLRQATARFSAITITAKMNGAVGNYNAHHIAYPEVAWPALSAAVLEQLGLQTNAYTTQIEPHDYMADYADALAHCHTIIIDFCRDMWGYIALNYFTLASNAQEIGSSTMPHKINPIDFENAEGNCHIANALLTLFSRQLPISRWQRDLSDSTILRNFAVAFGHSSIALQACHNGMQKLAVNQTALKHDLEANWEVLGEAIQTVMRRYGINNPYEKVKTLTCGKRLDAAQLRAFISELAIPEPEKQRLLALTPATYIGLASVLARGL